jgi:glycosyltransferase involved in cell wall biosynthesis
MPSERTSAEPEVFMRIGYLTSLYPSMSHTFIRREVDELRRRGLDIATFSVRAPAPDQLKSNSDTVSFKETGYLLPVQPMRYARAHLWALTSKPGRYLSVLTLALRHRPPGLKGLALSLAHFLESMVLAQEAANQRIDRLHNHFANSAANVGLLTTRYLDIPWSLTLHAHSETDYPAGLLLGSKIEASTFAACISYFGRAQAMRTVAPSHWPKLVISRCGIRLADLPPRQPRPPQGRRRVVCVARLSPEKAHSGLLMAFAELVGRGVDAELVLVGEGTERASIERMIGELNLKDRVTLRGHLGEQDTLAEIASADVFALASFMEGLPVVLIEAMALGVPAVASRLVGIPELIDDGREGLLFRPTDWSDLADKMHLLLTDAALCERLAAAAKAKIGNEFTIEKAVQPMYDYFTSAASR